MTPTAITFAYHNMGVLGLEALKRHGFDLLHVFTHHDAPDENCWFRSVREWCNAHGVRCSAPRDIHATKIIRDVRRAAPDFIFSFYYRTILSRNVLEAATRGAYNLHGSLLPRYRGRAPVNWAIMEGETQTGVTLHRMIEKPDAGDIVGAKAVQIDAMDTALAVYRKLEVAASELLDDVLPELAEGTAAHVPQDADVASYRGRRRPDDGRIDWGMPASRIFNLIRAVTTPYPGAFGFLAKQRVTIWWAVPAEDTVAPGRLLIDGQRVLAGTGNGSIELREIELKGRRYRDGEIAPALEPFAHTKLG